MPDYQLGFLGRYIAAAEFGGKEPTVTIASVQLELVEDTDEKKPPRNRWIVYFEGKERGWLLNKTNAILLAALFNSRKTEEWIGKRVTLCAEDVQMNGETLLGIRVRGGPDLRAVLEVKVKHPKKRLLLVRLIPTGKAPPATGDGHGG